MVKREKANYMIQSVSHALDVLEELAKAAGEVGVTELSKRLKLHKNNVFRLLATLELRGYVEQNRDTEDYRLGVKALQLGQSYLMQSKLVSRAAPILKALSEQLGETVSLAVLQNGQVQFPLSFEARKAVKVSPRVAVSFSGKHNAAGRLLIAQLRRMRQCVASSLNSATLDQLLTAELSKPMWFLFAKLFAATATRSAEQLKSLCLNTARKWRICFPLSMKLRLRYLRP
jgi:DNA-binding IclR family transcriptional regulator